MQIKRKKLLAAASAVVGSMSLSAFGATVTWNNATPPGLWSVAGNWTGGTGVPVAADTVVFGATGSATAAGTLTNEVDANFSITALQYTAQSDAGTPQDRK